MTSQPGRYDHLEFNSPLSDERADRVARSLAAAKPASVVDIGCGWGELMLRVLAAAPDASGIGVDNDGPLLDRGRANAAARGLDGRVQFVEADGAIPLDPAEVVLCVGSDHVFGDQRAALIAMHPLVAPGGRLLFGTGFWSRTPGAEEAAAVGMSPDSLLNLGDLVDLAVACGFRPLAVQTANTDEWEAFESGYLADWEEWLMTNPASADADGVRARADQHRAEWLHGYRDVLGFAYLVLGRPNAQSA